VRYVKSYGCYAPLSPRSHRVCCRIILYGIKRAAYGDADGAEFVVLLACPLGPIPLAARGLAAVLARAGPAGAVVGTHPADRRGRGCRAAVTCPP
jgi:hypothetical protein